MKEKVICQDRHGDKHEVDKSSLKTRISASGVLKHSHRYVMIQTEGSDLWELPGGGLELGETLEEALEREFVEETGLEVTKGKFITYRESFFFSDNSGQAYYTLRLFFEVVLKERSQQPSEDLLKDLSVLTEDTTNAITYSVLKDLSL